MQRRAPYWFTHGKFRQRVRDWWPWALGGFLAVLYVRNPEPIEEVRVAGLAAFRKPFLKASEWVELHDLDPETLALELPPEMLFGPLPVDQQMRFLMKALRDDNDLADDYVTRMIIDRMDLSLDPARDSEFVNNGAQELLQFAVDDFEDRRTNRKRKFFGPDQFLRLLTVCAPHYELANYFLEKCDGVETVFKALRGSENEYARVLATRTLTLLALLQKQNGLVEKQIVESGHLPTLVDTYRLSTGDPTDTRFSTMLLSSILRCFPQSEEIYNTLIAENIISAVCVNLNLTRYKGVPQHLRILDDLTAMRKNLKLTEPVSVPSDERLLVEAIGGVVRPATPAPRTKFQNWMEKGKERDEKSEKFSGGMIVDSVKMLPPRDLHASIEKLAYDAEFLPVALGVLDVFPEYFESSTAIMRWIERLLIDTKTISTFELLEYRGASVLAKAVGRLEPEPSFSDEGGPGQICYNICKTVMSDPECKAFTRKEKPAGTLEMQTALRNLREFMGRLELKRMGDERTIPTRIPDAKVGAA